MSTESLPHTPAIPSPHGASSRDGDLGAGPPVTGRFGAPGRLVAGVVLTNFAIWTAFFTPVIILVPAKVRDLYPDGYASALSLVLTISAIFGFVAGPVAGHLSDRSTSRFGRRRPWIAVFMVVGFAGNIITGAAGSLAVLTTGSVFSLIGFGATISILLTVLPEHVAPARRGSIGALLGVSQAAAVVLGVVVTGVLSSTPVVAFATVGVVGLIGAAVLWATLPDPQVGPHGPTQTRVADLLRGFWIDPRRHPDFAWAWLSRFALYFSFAAVTNYQLYYLIDQLGFSQSTAASWVAVSTAAQVLSTVVGALVGGVLSDRVGRRKPFVGVAAAIGVVGLVLLAVATVVAFFLAGIVLIGLATGVYASVDLALVTAVLPSSSDDAGKDLGVVNIANQLPQTLAPALAPALLAIGVWSVAGDAAGKNYTMLFAGSAVFALVSAIAVTRIRSVR